MNPSERALWFFESHFARDICLACEALFEFQIPNSPEVNAINPLNTAAGEINFCYWVKVEGRPIGKTVCDPAGENAGSTETGISPCEGAIQLVNCGSQDLGNRQFSITVHLK
jgi:hypothetical protein